MRYLSSIPRQGRRYEGQEPYAFAERDSIELHLARLMAETETEHERGIPVVDDADALYREWTQAGIDGRLVEPSDTSYGLREGACLDRDANLIRFGSAKAKGDPGS